MAVPQVLTPQFNSNLSATNDNFNHSNTHFWQYMQPGYDALDFISCTGTNFLVRSNAYQVRVAGPLGHCRRAAPRASGRSALVAE